MALKKSKKRSKSSSVDTLPICVAFVYCDQVVIGADKTATLVRIVDVMGVPVDSDRAAGDLFAIQGPQLFISLKKGEFSGDAKFSVICVGPDGKRSPIGIFDSSFKGNEVSSGQNVLAPTLFSWGGEGIYWMELTHEDGRVIARTPVTLKIGNLSNTKQDKRVIK